MRTAVFNLTIERNKKPLAMVVLIPHPSIAIELFGVVGLRWKRRKKILYCPSGIYATLWWTTFLCSDRRHVGSH
ncbi:MAG TPA: hypothetical protein VK147_05575 [Candidatus Didemnitutus sp.]|nr:hypothetical protein [Candidatus Didemnitutus sp.]